MQRKGDIKATEMSKRRMLGDKKRLQEKEQGPQKNQRRLQVTQEDGNLRRTAYPKSRYPK